MRFIDYNGSGGIDPQDIATSVAVETATLDEESDQRPGLNAAESGAGCATAIACIALSLLFVIVAL